MKGGEFASSGKIAYISEMADQVTNEQILECLKAIDVQLDHMASNVETILAELREFNHEMASLFPKKNR